MINEMEDAWRQAVIHLANVLPESDFETWITPIRYSCHDNSMVYLSVPNTFIKKRLESHYMKTLITSVLCKTSKQTVTTVIIVIDDKKMKSSQNSNLYLSEISQLNPKYTFKRFVSGPGNQFALAAAFFVANQPIDNAYNPLFIYGSGGIGKSHLLNAIGHTIRNNSPEADIYYCSAEKFMYEMANALNKNEMAQFRSHFSNLDLLLIDDIQFISGNMRAQEELLHIINELYGENKQIVIASNKSPRDMIGIVERLIFRFEWGLIADIQPPDLETKICFLNKLLSIRNIDMPDEVIRYIASNDISDLRRLEGVLFRLDAYSRLMNIPTTLDLAMKVLRDILGKKNILKIK